jgi:hypothetical protein
MWAHSSLEVFVNQSRIVSRGWGNEPSKSAMYVHTFELSAFTTILRSVGPVISTRRSTKPGAGGAPFQVALSRICLVSGRKSGKMPLSSSLCLMARRSRRAFRVELKVRWRSAKNAVASLERMIFWASLTEPWMATSLLMASMSTILQGLGVLKSILGRLVMLQLKQETLDNVFES